MIDVRIVHPPPENFRPAVIDGEALGVKAIARQAWQYESVHGGGARCVPLGYSKSPFKKQVDPEKFQTTCVVAIAAPSGQVAVWYGEMFAGSSDFVNAPVMAMVGAGPRPPPRPITASQFVLVQRAAQAWNSTSRNSEPRCVIAQAACRLLHAQVFAYEPTERDVLLVELWSLEPTRVLAASIETMQACAALLMINNEQGAAALLAGRPAFSRSPPPIERP